MKKVAVFLAKGFEEIEALTVVDYLRRAEVDVTTVAIPEKGTYETSPLVMGSHGIAVVSDMQLSVYLHSLKGELPDAVYAPGGMPGAANIATSETTLEFIQKCAASGKIVAAICAAPAVVLAKTGVLKGKKYTCYPGMEEGLEDYCGSSSRMEELMAGSTLVRSEPWVYDGGILTGKGPGAAEQFAMKLVELLVGPERADLIKKGSCQR